MAGNTVKLEFAGDSGSLLQESKKSQSALDDVGKAALSSGDDMKKSGGGADAYLDKIGKLGAGVTGMTDALDTAAGGMQALVDVQQAGAEKASRLARANIDVQQATEDMAQATRDAKQAQIDSKQATVDLEQAHLDQAKAMDDYTTAVKEHGKKSLEAQQAQIDLKQAGVDVTQAQEDAAQALRDGAQASIDAKEGQLNLNDAQREAHPPELQSWADNLNLISPLLSAMVGIVGLVTAAQWAWNSSLLASPVTWIVLGIAAVVAGIVLLVKHWDTVKKVGAAAWNWILDAGKKTWAWMQKIPGWIGGAFSGIARTISAPFRAAFNFISDAWNHTIGSLSWSVPGWIPGIGGNTISVPNLPRFHTGGVVPGPVGQETMAILQGGEEISRGGAGNGVTHVVVQIDRDTLLDVIAKGGRRGGPKFA